MYIYIQVLPLKTQALPVIIGGHDLVPYDKNAAKLAEQDWDDEPEVNLNFYAVQYVLNVIIPFLYYGNYN